MVTMEREVPSSTRHALTRFVFRAQSDHGVELLGECLREIARFEDGAGRWLYLQFTGDVPGVSRTYGVFHLVTCAGEPPELGSRPGTRA